MRTGGLSFLGGTAIFGGSVDAEERLYLLISNWLGRGAHDTEDEDKVRPRVMMVLGRMFANSANEAMRQAIESVPSKSIFQMDEWQEIFGLKYLLGVYGDIWLSQRFMEMIQRFTTSTPNIKRLANEVEKIMDAAKPPDGGLGVEGFENTRATSIGTDGERYFCILVPWTLTYGYGQWLISKTNRPLYRAIKWALQISSPAHTVPALSTTDTGAAGGRPAWYTDGHKDTGFSKDCVGS